MLLRTPPDSLVVLDNDLVEKSHHRCKNCIGEERTKQIKLNREKKEKRAQEGLKLRKSYSIDGVLKHVLSHNSTLRGERETD